MATLWRLFYCIMGAELIILQAVSLFNPNQTCIASNCYVTCGDITFDLSHIITEDNSWTQRVFSKIGIDYSYNFSVPLCGSLPENQNDNYDYHDSHVWQIVRSVSNSSEHQAYNALGLYSSSSWRIGTFANATALSVEYTNGDLCLVDSNSFTSSTLYMICDNRYNASDPLIIVKQDTSCKYSIQMSFQEICYTDNFSDTIASSTSNNESKENLYTTPGFIFLWCVLSAGFALICLIPGVHNNGGLFALSSYCMTKGMDSALNYVTRFWTERSERREVNSIRIISEKKGFDRIPTIVGDIETGTAEESPKSDSTLDNVVNARHAPGYLEVDISLHKHTLLRHCNHPYSCQLCHEVGEKWSYCCKQCMFFVHPQCAETQLATDKTQAIFLSAQTRHDEKSDMLISQHIHSLTKLTNTSYCCAICHKGNSNDEKSTPCDDMQYAYGCEICNYFVHIHCAEEIYTFDLKVKQLAQASLSSLTIKKPKSESKLSETKTYDRKLSGDKLRYAELLHDYDEHFKVKLPEVMTPETPKVLPRRSSDTLKMMFGRTGSGTDNSLSRNMSRESILGTSNAAVTEQPYQIYPLTVADETIEMLPPPPPPARRISHSLERNNSDTNKVNLSKSLMRSVIDAKRRKSGDSETFSVGSNIDDVYK